MKRFILLAAVASAVLPAMADYAVNFPDGTLQTACNPARNLRGVSIQTDRIVTPQYVSVGQTSGGPLYIDCTDRYVILEAGETVRTTFDWAGNWMNSYVYLDRGNDGRFDALMTDDAKPLPAAGSDVMAFSNYKYGNSAGEDVTATQANIMTLPPFTVPADLAAGCYRMRFKVDWDNVDPGGSTGEKNCPGLGGGIADVMAVVITPVTDAGQLKTVAGGGSITVDVNPDGSVTISALPDEGNKFTGVTIFNEFPVGPGMTPVCSGMTETTYASEVNSVTIPASMVTCFSTIRANFADATNGDDSFNYVSDHTGSHKDAKTGFTAITLGRKTLDVNSTSAHTFINRALDLQVSSPLTLRASYTGNATQFRFYIDNYQTGEFHEPLATGASLAELTEIRLPISTGNGVYRARLEAVGECDVDFLLNIYNPQVAFRPHALNGIILDSQREPLGETLKAFSRQRLCALPTLEGFAVDTVIVRHGQNLGGNAYVRGNRQWADTVISLNSQGFFTIPAEAVNGDIAVYALFGETEGSRWTKVWGDEFNGSEVDTRRWTRQPRQNAAWNRFVAISDAGNSLVNVIDDGYYNSWCIPTPESIAQDEAQNGNVPEMISGALISSGRFSVCYGKIEARVKTNPHSGNFPAFWMMPASSDLGDIGLSGWPNDGEIDIWEQINEQNIAHTTVHSGWTGWKSYNNWPVGPVTGSPASTTQTTADATIWHVYALEWDAEELRWHIDGKQVFSYRNQHYSEPGSPYYCERITWPFYKEFYILVNQSVGTGSWANAPDTDHRYLTQFDYVRVYQRKGVGTKTSLLSDNGDDPNFYTGAGAAPDYPETDIKEITADDVEAVGDVRLFDLAGRRVAGSPATPGLYIRQQGTKATKIIIR